MTADEVFFRAANAAAAAYAKAPAFATYRLQAAVSVGHAASAIDKRIAVRLADQVAVVTNDPTATLRAPFPAPPDFDPLSHFTLTWSFVRGDATSSDVRVFNVDPLHFAATRPGGADVVVRALRHYRIAFAADSASDGRGPVHLTLQRLGRAQIAYRDVWLDPLTDLPRRVAFAFDSGGHRGTVTTEYATVGGTSLLTGFHMHDVASVLPFVHVTYDLAATYADYAFPATAPDPRFEAAPVPTASGRARVGTPAAESATGAEAG